jgi:hypothetical protein
VAAGRDGVAVVDLGGWFAALPPGEDARLRPDGVHVTLDTTMDVAGWLGPQILAAARSAGFVPPAPPAPPTSPASAVTAPPVPPAAG